MVNGEVKDRRAARITEGQEGGDKFAYLDGLSTAAPLPIFFDDLLRWSTNSICFVED
jgi:hypothetical protein